MKKYTLHQPAPARPGGSDAMNVLTMPATRCQAAGALDANITEERMKVVLEALWETEVVVVDLLRRLAAEEWELEHEPAMMLRAMAARLKVLCGVAMSGLDDRMCTTEELSRAVFGVVKAPAGEVDTHSTPTLEH